jgi:CrcB protein
VSAATWAGVALLGGVGAVLRVAVTEAVAARVRAGLPAGTLAVNLSGCFALGVLTASDLGHDALLLLGTALVGAYTTFSALMLEADRLGPRRAGLGYVALSLVLGLAATGLGRLVG